MAQNNDDVDLIATEYLNNNVINEDVVLQGHVILLPNG
jgi:uncharacterized protein